MITLRREFMTRSPISESDVTDFETQLGISLPIDYREFLIKTNGGIPFPHKIEFSVENRPDTTSVEYFYGLLSEDSSQSLKWACGVFDDLLAKKLLPIAGDAFGNKIVLCLSDGTVWFWDHEEPDQENALFFISESAKNLFDEIADTQKVPDKDSLESILDLDDLEGMKRLLADGMTPETEVEKGITVLNAATSCDAIKISEFLLKQGGDPEKAFYHALNYGKEQIALLALKALRNDWPQEKLRAEASSHGWLHVATWDKHTALVRMLLECGVEVNAVDSEGYSALALAHDPEIQTILKTAGGKEEYPEST